MELYFDELLKYFKARLSEGTYQALEVLLKNKSSVRMIVERLFSQSKFVKSTNRMEKLNLDQECAILKRTEVTRSVSALIDALCVSSVGKRSNQQNVRRKRALNDDAGDIVTQKRRKTSNCSSVVMPTQKTTTITFLPPEMIVHIFAFLGFHETVRCGLACRNWYDLSFQSRSHEHVNLSQYFAGTVTPNYHILDKMSRRFHGNVRSLCLANCRWVCTGDILRLLGLPVAFCSREECRRFWYGHATCQRREKLGLRYLEYFMAVSTGNVISESRESGPIEINDDSTESGNSYGTGEDAESGDDQRRSNDTSDLNTNNQTNVVPSSDLVEISDTDQEVIQYRNAMMGVRYNASQPSVGDLEYTCPLEALGDVNTRGYGEAAKYALLEFKYEKSNAEHHDIGSNEEQVSEHSAAVGRSFLEKMVESDPESFNNRSSYPVALQDETLCYRYVSPATDLLFPWHTWKEMCLREKEKEDLVAFLRAVNLGSTKTVKSAGIGNEREHRSDAFENFTHVLPLPASRPTGTDNFFCGEIQTLDSLPDYFASPVETLDLEGCNLIHLTNLPLLLSYCPNIRVLSLKSCNQLTERSLIYLINSGVLDNIKCLRLDYLYQAVTDSTLQAIATKCKQLQELNMWGCSRVTDAGMETIARNCSSLAKLATRGCTTLTDVSLRALGKHCSNLAEANLSGICSFTAYGLAAIISECSKLNKLKIDIWYFQQPPEIQKSDPKSRNTEENNQTSVQRRSYRSLTSLKSALVYLSGVLPREHSRFEKIASLKQKIAGDLDARSLGISQSSK